MYELISAASQEIAASSEEVNSSTEEVSKSAVALNNITVKMIERVNKFKLRDFEV